jgi:hypothetical protein
VLEIRPRIPLRGVSKWLFLYISLPERRFLSFSPTRKAMEVLRDDNRTKAMGRIILGGKT